MIVKPLQQRKIYLKRLIKTNSTSIRDNTRKKAAGRLYLNKLTPKELNAFY